MVLTTQRIFSTLITAPLITFTVVGYHLMAHAGMLLSMFGSSGDDLAVRDYVYLDPGTLDSWYASLHGWVPESRQQGNETNVDGQASAGAKGEAALPLLEWLGKLGLEGNLGGSVSAQRMTETTDRVIDQGLHTQLRNDLDEKGLIKSVDDDLEAGDVVEVTGTGMTDPLYRQLFAIKRLVAIQELEEISQRLETLEDDQDDDEDRPDLSGGREGVEDPRARMQQEDPMGMMGGDDPFGLQGENPFADMLGGGQNPGLDRIGPSASDVISEDLNEALNAIYGENTCLLLDLDQDKTKGADGTFTQCGMLLTDNHIQTEPNEFLAAKEYTALGRVVEISEDGEWDYAEVLRVADTVMSRDEMEEFRSDFEDSIDDTNSSEGLNIDTDLFSSDEPLIAIKPVAVYW